MKGYSEVRLKLPDHLVKWLEEFARQTARTPDQLLAYILEHYYQAWKIGYDAGREIAPFQVATSKGEVSIEKILSEFKEDLLGRNLSKKTINDRLIVTKKFLRWCMERNIDLASIGVEQADLFIKELNIKKSTKSFYKYHLSCFVKFLQERLREGQKQ